MSDKEKPVPPTYGLADITQAIADAARTTEKAKDMGQANDDLGVINPENIFDKDDSPALVKASATEHTSRANPATAQGAPINPDTFIPPFGQQSMHQNVQEIAKRGEELYDKFVGFVGDLELLGNRLKQAQHAYDGAHGKLKSGKGNLVGQAEKLRKLGLKPSKKLPKELLGFKDVDDIESKETTTETVM